MKGLSQHEQVVTEPTTLTAWPASGTLLSGSLADLGKEVATPAPLGPAHLRKKRLEVCESSSLGHRSTWGDMVMKLLSASPCCIHRRLCNHRDYSGTTAQLRPQGGEALWKPRENGRARQGSGRKLSSLWPHLQPQEAGSSLTHSQERTPNTDFCWPQFLLSDPSSPACKSQGMLLGEKHIKRPRTKFKMVEMLAPSAQDSTITMIHIQGRRGKTDACKSRWQMETSRKIQKEMLEVNSMERGLPLSMSSPVG